MAKLFITKMKSNNNFNNKRIIHDLHCRNVTFNELFLLKPDIEVRQYAYIKSLSASFTANAQTKMRYIVCPPNCSIKSVKPLKELFLFSKLLHASVPQFYLSNATGS